MPCTPSGEEAAATPRGGVGVDRQTSLREEDSSETRKRSANGARVDAEWDAGIAEMPESFQVPRWNVMLQDALEACFNKGVPLPTRSASTCKELQTITDESFVHKQFIRDSDGILYKLESTAPFPASPTSCSSPSFSSPASLPSARLSPGLAPAVSASPSSSAASRASAAPSCVCGVCREAADSLAKEGSVGEKKRRCLDGGWCDAGEEPPVYVQPSQLLLYVAYPHFQGVWSSGASEVLLHFLSGKELANCNVMALDRAACRYDLLIEISNLPQSPELRSELALQLSRLRLRLQCGPLQRFFRSHMRQRAEGDSRQPRKRKPDTVKRVVLRDGEAVYLYSTVEPKTAAKAPQRPHAEAEGGAEENGEAAEAPTGGSEATRKLLHVVFCWATERLSACDAVVARWCVEDVAQVIRHALELPDTPCGADAPLSAAFSSQLPPRVLEFEAAAGTKSAPSDPPSAASPPLCLSLSVECDAAFAPSLPSMTRCIRALALSEILVSLYPLVFQRLLHAEKMLFKRLTRESLSLLR